MASVARVKFLSPKVLVDISPGQARLASAALGENQRHRFALKLKGFEIARSANCALRIWKT